MYEQNQNLSKVVILVVAVLLLILMGVIISNSLSGDDSNNTLSAISSENVTYIKDAPVYSSKLITENLESLPSLSVFKDLLKSSDLYGKFVTKNDKYTLFIPDNESLSGSLEQINELKKPENKELLNSYLKYYILSGEYNLSQITSLLHLNTLQGERLEVKNESGIPKVNNSEIKNANLYQKNGIIHTLNSPLVLPDSVDINGIGFFRKKGLYENISLIPEFSSISSLIKQSGLEEEIKTNNFSMFIPSNSAISNLSPETINNLLKPESKDTLVKLIKNHLIKSTILASELQNDQQIESLGGLKYKIKIEGQNLQLIYEQKTINIVKADLIFDKGNAFILDNVLMD